MRKIDINKIEAIKQSVLDLSWEKGVSNLTTAEISKKAGVSPATLYIHYYSKKDLISRLYEKVKVELQNGISEVMVPQDDLHIKIKKTLYYAVQKYKKYPKKAKFVSTLWSNQDMLDKQAIKFGNEQNRIISDLVREILEDGRYVNVSSSILEIFLAIPTQAIQQISILNGTEIDNIIDMVIKSLEK